MRHILIRISGLLTLLLGVWATFGAERALAQTSGAACPPPGLFVVDGSAGHTPAIVNGGFNCPAVDLVVSVDLDPVMRLIITAKSFKVVPLAGAPGNVQIVNDHPDSDIIITAVGATLANPAPGGDIIIDRGDLKAHRVLKFVCTGQSPACTFKADNSALIAASDPGFGNPQAGGGLFFDIFGPIDIHTTNVHGGNVVEMTSRSSSITMICGSGDGACKSPVVPPIPPIVLAQCPPQPGDPPGTLIHFPCDLDIPNAAALQGVCFPSPAGVPCNGGAKEKRFTAGTFIDFTGSTITSDEHVTFTCKGLPSPIPGSGDLKASGATFLFHSLFIDCKGKVDLSDARLVMVTHFTSNTGVNCPAATLPAGATCINVAGAEITARPLTLTASGGDSIIDACGAVFTVHGSGFPKLNNKTTPATYPQTTVKFTDAQCGGPGTGATFLND
jgi:hypothetical protein